RLVGGDRRALHTDPVLLDRFGGFDRHAVVGRIAVLDPEVVVLQVDVEVGKDQLLLDELPDDPGHLVAVELDDRVLHLDLRHVRSLLYVLFGGRLDGAGTDPPGGADAIARAVPGRDRTEALAGRSRRLFVPAGLGGVRDEQLPRTAGEGHGDDVLAARGPFDAAFGDEQARAVARDPGADDRPAFDAHGAGAAGRNLHRPGFARVLALELGQQARPGRGEAERHETRDERADADRSQPARRSASRPAQPDLVDRRVVSPQALAVVGD